MICQVTKMQNTNLQPQNIEMLPIFNGSLSTFINIFPNRCISSWTDLKTTRLIPYAKYIENETVIYLWT